MFIQTSKSVASTCFCFILMTFAGVSQASPQPHSIQPDPASLQHIQNLSNLFSLQRYRLSTKLFSPDLSVANLRLRSLALLKQLYKRRDYQPIWTQASGLNHQGLLLFMYLRQADEHGLEPEEYNVSLISLCLNSLLMDNCENADLELLLSDAYLRYSTHLNRGRFSPTKTDKQWFIIDKQPWKPIERLEQALASDNLLQLLVQLPPQQPQYAKLKALLKQYRRLAADTLWPLLPQTPKLELGTRHPALSLVYQRLWESGDLRVGYCADAGLEVFDKNLQQGVKNFQQRHGLKPDGVIGPLTRAMLNHTLEERIEQIRWNMERWRWLPEDLGQNYITVNAASFELELIQEGKKTDEMRVIVGRKDRQTPSFTAQMSYLVINPSWNVPYNIAVNDILPKLRSDPSYLEHKNMSLSDGKSMLDARYVNWNSFDSNHFPFRISQLPGDNNALGTIKFMFPNNFDIYLHDTPSRSLFKKSQRTFSSGCVRVEEPHELAQNLLGWSNKKLQAALRKGKTQTVPLPTRLPVYLLYWTVWVDDDNNVQFRPDVYQRDTALQKAFASLNPTEPEQAQVLLQMAKPEVQ